MKAITLFTAALLFASGAVSSAQAPNEKEYLSAMLPPDLIRYAGLEVPSHDNVRILSDEAGRYLEFRLIPEPLVGDGPMARPAGPNQR